ncbi:MAG: hypothetical protein HS128_05355 [Ideonella sp.]|nr:hypothetical protein [Ideonella sp.]MCC7457206.1 hypothetical protein [Nitrospira sp.]
MKWMSIALAFVATGSLACPAGDAKDARAMPDKAAVEAKAPAATTPTKPVASKKAQATKVVDKSATALPAKSSL